MSNEHEMEKPVTETTETPTETNAAETTAPESTTETSQGMPGQITLHSLSALQAAPMLKVLEEGKNAEEHVKAAHELAERIAPDGMITEEGNRELLNAIRPALDQMGAVAKKITANTTLGESDALGKILSDFQEIKEDLNLESVKDPDPWYSMLPFIGKLFKRAYQLKERMEKINPKIDSKEHTLREEIGNREIDKEHLAALKKAVLDTFLSLEIAIAAGEIALGRGQKRYEEDWQKVNGTGTADLRAREELNERNRQITNLDNRLMRTQNSRTRGMTRIVAINQARDLQDKLKGTLEDLLDITINEIRTAAGLAKILIEGRKATKVAKGVNDLNRGLDSMTAELADKSLDEIHAVNMGASEEARQLIDLGRRWGEILDKARAQEQENRTANAKVREEGREFEQEFLQKLAGSLDAPAPAPTETKDA